MNYNESDRPQLPSVPVLVGDRSLIEPRKNRRNAIARTVGPTVVSTLGLSVLAVIGAWLHPAGALSQNQRPTNNDGVAKAKITRIVQDPFTPQPPPKFDMPPPPAFVTKRKQDPKPEPVAKTDPFPEPARFKVAPPPPQWPQPKTEIVAKPPTFKAPPKLDFSTPAPAPSIVLGKRTCPAHEKYDRVSRDFSVAKSEVRLDPELKAEAPRIRRLEIREDSTPAPAQPIVQTVSALAPAAIPTPGATRTVRSQVRADRIELRTVPVLRKTNTPTLLIARAMDALGQPAANVLIEWSVDRRGVGHIVTIPEMFRGTSESTPETDRAEKVLPTFARTFTAGKPYRLEALDAEGIPVEIQAGEACCYVNSPLAGDMAVVAIAPSIARTERREAGLKLHWSNVKADFPKNLRVATGSDVFLATRVLHGVDGRPLPGYSVRYRVTNAEQTARGEDPVDKEVATDNDGQAVFKRNRPIRESGTDKVEIQLLGANTLQGDNAVVLAKSECRIEWFDPKLELKVDNTPIARVGDWLPVKVQLANHDQIALSQLRITAESTPAVEFSAVSQSAPPMHEIGSLKPGQTESWKLMIRSKEAGKMPIHFVVHDGRGMRSSADAVVQFDLAKVTLEKLATVTLAVGQQHEHSIVVRNNGAVTARSVEVEDDLPAEIAAEAVDGLRLMDRLLWRVGDLEPGTSRKLTARWTARKPFDAVALRARASQSGVLLCDAYSRLTVRGCPALAVEIADSADPVEVGKPLTLTVRIRNRGSAAAENVALVGVLPQQLTFIGSSGALSARCVDGRVRFDSIARIETGETMEGVLHVKATRPGEARTSLRLFHEAVGPDGIETQESTSVFVALESK